MINLTVNSLNVLLSILSESGWDPQGNRPIYFSNEDFSESLKRNPRRLCLQLIQHQEERASIIFSGISFSADPEDPLRNIEAIYVYVVTELISSDN